MKIKRDWRADVREMLLLLAIAAALGWGYTRTDSSAAPETALRETNQ